MTTFKVIVVKTKFIVAKYDYRPLISSPALNTLLQVAWYEKIKLLNDFSGYHVPITC